MTIEPSLTEQLSTFRDGYVGIDVEDFNDVMTDAAWEAWDVFTKTLEELGISVTEIANVRLAIDMEA